MLNIFKRNSTTTKPNPHDIAYGGFLISKNVTKNGKKIRYSYREKSSISELNGWNIYSVIDDDDYVKNPDNFEIVSASTIYKIAPVMIEIFDAPYGTDLYWLYKNNVHIGFYDLKQNKEVSIKEILKK